MKTLDFRAAAATLVTQIMLAQTQTYFIRSWIVKNKNKVFEITLSKWLKNKETIDNMTDTHNTQQVCLQPS